MPHRGGGIFTFDPEVSFFELICNLKSFCFPILPFLDAHQEYHLMRELTAQIRMFSAHASQWHLHLGYRCIDYRLLCL